MTGWPNGNDHNSHPISYVTGSDPAGLWEHLAVLHGFDVSAIDWTDPWDAAMMIDAHTFVHDNLGT